MGEFKVGALFNRYWKVTLGVTLAICLIGVLAKLSLFNNSLSESSKMKDYSLNIALVNEDQGGLLNNQKYNFGDNFTKYVENDNDNSWNVTSRSIADSGLKDNTYDMELIIPSNFTQQSIQLQSKNPKKAQIIYKLNPNRNKNMRYAAQTKASAVLNNFNRKIVNMYFSSIIGNLHNAQANTSNMINRENYLNRGLTSNVNKPFSELNNQFSALSSTSSALQSEYGNFKQSAESYNQQTNDVLTTLIQNNQNATQSISDFSAQQTQINDENKTGFDQNYQDLMAQEGDLNNQWLAKLTGNDQQATTDYSSLTDYVKQYLGIDQTDGETSTGFAGQLQQIKANNQSMQDQLDSISSPYTEAVTDLNTEKDNLANFFYGTNDANSFNDTQMTNHFTDQISEALDTISDSETGSQSDKGLNSFQTYLNQYVAKIPSTSSNDMNGLISILSTSGDQSTLSSEIDLINKYASENKVQLGTSTSTNYSQALSSLESQTINNAKGSDSTIALPTKKDDTVTIKISPDSATSAGVTWNRSADQTTLNSNKTISSSYTVTDSGNSITITAKDDNPEAGTVTYTPTFTVKGSVLSKLNGGSSVTYKATIGSATLSGQAIDISSFLSSKKDLQADFTDLSNNISATYNLIAILYGGDANESGAGLLGSTSLAKQATSNGSEIYLALTGGDHSEVASAVAKKLVKSLHEQNAVMPDQMIAAINTQIDKLNGEKDSSVADWTDALQKQSDALDALEGSIQTMNDSLPTMKELNEDPIKYDPISEYEIKVDDTSGPALIAQLSQLSDSVNEQAKATQSSAAQVPDLQSQFTQLQNDTSTLSGQSQALINNASSLTNSWVDTVNKNNDYNQGFQKVLDNTKNGGADNSQVYKYLTNPVKSTNEGTSKSQASLIPYYLVLISAFSALFTSYILSRYEEHRKIKHGDKFTDTNSLLWKNTPWTGVITLVGLLEGGIMAYFVRGLFSDKSLQMFKWVLIIMAVQLLLVTLGSYLIRQFKTGGMMILILFIALYIILTPSLGITITEQSFTAMIANLSPLQSMENVYTNLIDSSQFNLRILLFILICAGLSIIANLVVKQRTPGKSVTDGKTD